MGTRWIPWAELLKRVFDRPFDVLRREVCGGRREVLAFLTEPDVVRAFLECVRLPEEAPPIAPARQIEIDVG
ncbi:MAG: ATP-dependent helicase HrpA [Planctomycetes bacterium]|nr:ATP-dependent helicase HrpA [Planctomycetota bacterium]